MHRHSRTPGQAIVEFALAATLIFFLLAATVDIGLMMFTLQGLHNAAQEGATYGSRWLTIVNDKRVPNKAEIIDRIRHEAGDRGGIGFVNLLDLNADGIFDDQQPTVLDQQIAIDMLADSTTDGDPTLENTPCDDASASIYPCYIRVTVRANYRMIFPLAPAFSRVVPLHSTFVMPVRDSVSR